MPGLGNEQAVQQLIEQDIAGATDFSLMVTGLAGIQRWIEERVTELVGDKADALLSEVPTSLQGYFDDMGDYFKRRYEIALIGTETTPDSTYPSSILSDDLEPNSDFFEGTHEELVTALENLQAAWKADIIVDVHSSEHTSKVEFKMYPNTPENQQKLAALEEEYAALPADEEVD